MGVGFKIKEYIESNNILQTNLSIDTHIPLPKLNLALNEKRKMTFEEFELICGALEVPVSKFLSPKLPTKRGA
jgi:hypothetical protein